MLRGVTVPDARGETGLRAEEVTARISVYGFLVRRRMEVLHWMIRGAVLHLEKNKEGSWNWKDFPSTGRAPVDLREFLIKYRDGSASPAFSQTVKVASAVIRNSPLPGSSCRITGNFSLLPGNALFRFDASYTSGEDSLVFDAKSAGGGLDFYGEARELTRGFFVKFHLGAHHQELENLVPGMRGKLTAQIDGTAHGSHPSSLRRYLRGEGAFDIRSGVFLPRNLIGEILRTIRPADSASGLPASEYRALLTGRGTPFEMVQGRFQAVDGKVFFSDVRIKHADFMFEGEGSVGLEDLFLDLRARMVGLEKFSAWIVQRSPDYKPFLNAQGRLVVPFLYRGLLPDVSPEADWDKAARLMEVKS